MLVEVVVVIMLPEVELVVLEGLVVVAMEKLAQQLQMETGQLILAVVVVE